MLFISSIIMVYAQHIVEYSAREHAFFRVNQLNDFSDRFNRVESSSFLNYIKKRGDESSEVTRDVLLYSLFHNNGKKMEEALKDKFINHIIFNNVKISENTENWYAKVNCLFTYQERELDLDLVLKFVHDTKFDGYKWEIVKVEKLKNRKTKKIPSKKHLSGNDEKRVISPVSNEVHFIDLRRYLSDLEHLTDYFIPIRNENEQNFILQLQSEKLKFEQVNEISYHFLQLEGWIFKVAYIDQNKLNPKNTGWLMTHISEADHIQKNKYKHEELYFE